MTDDELVRRVRGLFNPKTRGYWIVALVLLLAGGGWGSWRAVRYVRAAEAEAERSDGLLRDRAALRTLLDVATARNAGADSTLRETRDSLATVRAGAREERAGARQTITGLLGRVEAAAGDSAAVVALVDSLQAAHEVEVGSLEVQLAAADSTISVLDVRLGTADSVIVAQRAALANSDSIGASFERQAGDWEAAYRRASNLGLFGEIKVGGKWAVAGFLLGFVATR